MKANESGRHMGALQYAANKGKLHIALTTQGILDTQDFFCYDPKQKIGAGGSTPLQAITNHYRGVDEAKQKQA